MVTTDIINGKFIAGVTNKGLRKIHRIQEDVIRANFRDPRGQRLADFIAKYPVDAFDRIGGHYRTVRLFSYMRLLDIIYSGRGKHQMFIRRRLAIYNRVVWGVLYGETLPALIYGLTEDIRRSIRENLEKSLK